MTRYAITADAGEVAIEIKGVADKQDELLAAFGECQQGQCSCPTDEYEKVESMEVVPSRDAISIRLVAKPGEQLDRHEISTCLDYTLAKTERPQQDA